MYPETFFFVPLTDFVSDYLIVSIVITRKMHARNFARVYRVQFTIRDIFEERDIRKKSDRESLLLEKKKEKEKENLQSYPTNLVTLFCHATCIFLIE